MRRQLAPTLGHEADQPLVVVSGGLTNVNFRLGTSGPLLKLYGKGSALTDRARERRLMAHLESGPTAPSRPSLSALPPFLLLGRYPHLHLVWRSLWITSSRFGAQSVRGHARSCLGRLTAGTSRSGWTAQLCPLLR